MVGGEESHVQAAKEVLSYMGKNVVHCGGPGTGGIAKICHNLVLGINMGGVAEAMNLGVKLGMYVCLYVFNERRGWGAVHAFFEITYLSSLPHTTQVSTPRC